jgi:DNA-binding PadR family transcriptional regulator
MSSIRLLILGVLLRKQPTHGYDVRRELEQRHADKWANIAYGSIYSALGKMAEEGLVQAVDNGQCERPTARTEYLITEQGRAEFERLLQEYWWELKPTIDPFQIALTFMDRLPPAQLLQALRHRADLLRASSTSLHILQPEPAHGEGASYPRHLAEGARLMQAHIEVELSWIEDVCAKIERGEFP